MGETDRFGIQDPTISRQFIEPTSSTLERVQMEADTATSRVAGPGLAAVCEALDLISDMTIFRTTEIVPDSSGQGTNGSINSRLIGSSEAEQVRTELAAEGEELIDEMLVWGRRFHNFFMKVKAAQME